MELKDEDGYVICSEAIAGSVKNNLTDGQVAAAFDGDDGPAIAENFLSLGEDSGDKAVIALDIYDKAKQDDDLGQPEADQPQPDDEPAKKRHNKPL